MSTLRLILAVASAAAVGALFGGPAASPALAVSCSQEIFDGGGYRYDFRGSTGLYAALSNGGSNGPQDTPPGPVSAFDSWDGWGGLFLFAPGADLSNPGVGDIYSGGPEACEMRVGGREIAFPVAEMHGLQAHRRWYVDPGLLNGARSLTVLHNPSTAPISVTVTHDDPLDGDDLGSDNETRARATSDGSGTFSPASTWGVTSDGVLLGGSLEDRDPALTHVWDGVGGAMRASEVVLGVDDNADVLYWDWKVSVPARATVAFISYEIQAAVPGRLTADEVALGVAQGEARQKQSPASLYVGMSATEIAGTMNWPHPPPTATIAPVSKANAATQVRLDGGASTNATGLPQCPIAGYAWETDDGAKGSGATLSHFFGPGMHTATLTVTNNCGGAQSTKTTFKVANGIKLGKLKLNRRAGTAKLQVKALGAGRLTLSGKGIKKQAKQLKKAGKPVLTLKPTGKALSTLRRNGKAKVRVTVALTPKGGKVSKLTKAVVLKLR